jgi:hypothetical protein
MKPKRAYWHKRCPQVPWREIVGTKTAHQVDRDQSLKAWR